jgi:broad specificity phosphatase PhoE
LSDREPRSTVLRPGITLYLIRHGETDWNRDQRYQGQRDIPLNETGRQQALANGRTLKRLMPDIAGADFVSSPLSRAVDTMQLMRGEMRLLPTDFRCDPQLLELNYGHWEGELASELARSDPIGVAAKAADPFGWRPRGGESYADLMTRIVAWLTALDRDTIAVTHGGVSRVARGAILGLETREVPFLDAPQDKILFLRRSEMRWL